MFKTYWHIAKRNFIKNKLFSSINLLGLSIGMAIFILILQIVSYEFSYDSFQRNRDNIYRVYYTSNKMGSTIQVVSTPAPMGPSMKEDMPAVADFVRISTWGESIAKYNNVSLKIGSAYIADASFFHVFSFPLLKGNPATALAEPTSAVVSASLAKKLFKDEEPLGKQFTYGIENTSYVVRGVFEDVPENSNLKFDLLLSIRNELKNDKYNGNWRGSFNFKTYVLLNPKVNWKSVDKDLTAFYEKYLGDKSEKIFHLQPLGDVHLHSAGFWEPDVKPGERGDSKSMYFLIVIAVLILIIAWLNYINLSTARAIDRSKEVGMRKVVGASRWQLIKQFLIESCIFNMVGIVIAIGLVFICLPAFNKMFGLQLSFFILLSEWLFWVPVVLLLGVGIFVSGFCTAFVLSSFNPISALKGELVRVNKGFNLRKVLVIFQFTICVIFIAGTLCIYLQIKLMRETDLGININDVVLVSNPTYLKFDKVVADGQAFVDELRKHPEIKDITLSNFPGQEYFATDLNMRRQNSSEKYEIKIAYVDYAFLSTYEVKLLAGRHFSKEFPSDSMSSMLINESAARLLGFDSPAEAVGQSLIGGRGQKTIIGVIRDYHQQYIKKAVDPVCFIMHRYSPHQYYSIKLNKNKEEAAISIISTCFRKFFPDYPMDYMFLKDLYGRQYIFEKRFGIMCNLLSLIAVVLACLGLFALSSYTLLQRAKEISVRKVLGAKMNEILYLLSKDFFKLVFLAAMLAFPLAFWGLSNWLDDFAIRISIGWWFFVVPIIIVLPIVLATVAFNVYNVATNNPVKALRNE